MLQIQSFMYFLFAGLCEIDGYLVWLWPRENMSFWYAVIGVFILVLYGIVSHASTRLPAAIVTSIHAKERNVGNNML